MKNVKEHNNVRTYPPSIQYQDVLVDLGQRFQPSEKFKNSNVTPRKVMFFALLLWYYAKLSKMEHLQT